MAPRPAHYEPDLDGWWKVTVPRLGVTDPGHVGWLMADDEQTGAPEGHVAATSPFSYAQNLIIGVRPSVRGGQGGQTIQFSPVTAEFVAVSTAVKSSSRPQQTEQTGGRATLVRATEHHGAAFTARSHPT